MLGWRASRRKWHLSDVTDLPSPQALTSSGAFGATGSRSLCRGDGAWARDDGVDYGSGDWRVSGAPGGSDSRRLAVFPERRTLGVAAHICAVHGGRLPVPENFAENKVALLAHFYGTVSFV